MPPPILSHLQWKPLLSSCNCFPALHTDRSLPAATLIYFQNWNKGLWKQIWDQGGFHLSCKSVPQQYVYFMVCRGNTIAPTKMANVYRRRRGIFWKRILFFWKTFDRFWERAKSQDIFRPPLVLLSILAERSNPDQMHLQNAAANTSR